MYEAMKRSIYLWGVFWGVLWLGLQGCTPLQWQRYTLAGREAFRQGRYVEAERLFLVALQEAENLELPNTRIILTLNDLARLYHVQGRYGQAETLLQRALRLSEELEPKSLHVVMTLNNLAGLYYTQGRYGEAENLLTRALAIGQALDKMDHPELVTTQRNLRLVAQAQQKGKETASVAGELSESQETGPGPPASRRSKQVEIIVSYQEPTVRRDGSPLTDLSKTTIYYDNGNGPVKAAEVPATTGKGGGTVVQTILLPFVPDTPVTLWVTATDSRGQESEAAEKIVLSPEELRSRLSP
ncbi:MAG: tetratricopeptide repeat protein [Nitrospinota bacterium]|nr:MAG: tetratricopeptide repeat protein [Nitrospinota bacterium]